jgi:hypothetical protein
MSGEATTPWNDQRRAFDNLPDDLENASMTTTDPNPAPYADAWAQQLAQLRSRYKHVREPILVALNVLLHDQNVSLDDAKARASLHGVKITAASVSAAQRLLSRMNERPAPTTSGMTAAKRASRRVRATDPGVDAEALIRQVVGKIQNQGNADAERMREAMRTAIAVLQAAGA